MKPEIIYEDADIILCHKPAGVATQTKRLGQQDMESLLKNYRATKGEPAYIGVVHRLDQPVEGLMVFAKNKEAAANLSKQIQAHLLGKYYYAVSEYAPEQPERVLEDYLLTDKRTNYTTVVENCEGASGLAQPIRKEAKRAKLEYRVVESVESGVLFDIKLHTGRQHQIRVQLAHMGCPLVGDSKYGRNAENGDGKAGHKGGACHTAGALALCAYRLEFVHPVTGKPMDVSIRPQGMGFGAFFQAEKAQNLDNSSDIGIR